MRSSTRSMLIGAAVAALLVLPAAGADTGWVSWPTKSYDTKGLRIDDVVGDVRVIVQDGPMKVDVSGSKELVAGLTVKNEGGIARRSTAATTSTYFVWDWRNWFDFSHIRRQRARRPSVDQGDRPQGYTDQDFDDLIGNAAIGDTYRPGAAWNRSHRTPRSARSARPMSRSVAPARSRSRDVCGRT